MKILKTVLLEVLGFVLLTVCGTVGGGLLFMLYGAATSFVVGSHINVFLPNTFLDGMLICFPPIMLFVPMLRMLSLVRHESKNKIAGISTISVLSLCTWLFCVPICAKAAIEGNVLEDKAPTELTSGYFREIGNDVYYFNSISGNTFDGVKFENDYANRASGTRRMETLKNEKLELKRDQYGFSDPLVGEQLEPPSVVSKFFFMLVSMEKAAFTACASGFGTWLCFSSIMFALVAAVALVSVSTWRLVCVFWILLSTSLTILLNHLYIDSYFASFLSQLDYRGAFFGFIKNNFQPIMNGIIIFVLVVAGILCTIFKNKNFSGEDL